MASGHVNRARRPNTWLTDQPANVKILLPTRSRPHMAVESRAADSLKHVSGCSLLLQRFTQFVQQPRVLDGDDSLSSEILDQRYLLVSKWSNFLPVDDDRADQRFVLKHGHRKMRLRTCKPGRSARYLLGRVV